MEVHTHTHYRRNELYLFLALTFGLSAIFYFQIISDGTLLATNSFNVLLLTWCPGIAAVLTRLFLHGSLQGLGWKLGKGKYLLLGYLLPLLYGGLVYSIIWATGLGAFDQEMVDNFTLAEGATATPSLAALSFVGLGTLQACLAALGEELGWRGYLVPAFYRRKTFLSTSLLSGLIWALWYAPLILFADYHSGTPLLYGLACFVIMAVGLSFAFAWLRLKSCSVWPAVLLHASHSLYINRFFDRFTADTGITAYLTTEFGAGLALAALLIALFFYSRRDQIYRDPEALPHEEADGIIIPSTIE